MKPAQLLAHFDRISEAPDAIPRLRRFILDLAVLGRLVEQDLNDEPASEMLKRIRAEKGRLVKQGVLKKQEPLPPVDEDELSYAVPKGWAAASLGFVAVCLDYMREPVNTTEREQRIAGKDPAELVPYYGATKQQGWIDDYLFDEDLVLLGEDGVPFFDALRPKAYLISGRSWVNNHAHVFRGIMVSNPFIVHCLNTFDYTGRIVGATRQKLNQAKAVDIPIVLPPLAEQHRIVAKVDELMALCDGLEAAQAERENRRNRLAAASLHRLSHGTEGDAFRKHVRFHLANLPRLTTRPEHVRQLREAILELGVTGRLSEQLSSDGNAQTLLDQLKLARCKAGKTRRQSDSDSEPLPQLPTTWTWASVDQVAAEEENSITDGPFGANLKTEHYVDSPGFRVIRLQNIGRGHFREEHRSYISRERFELLKKHRACGGDLVVAGLVDPFVRCCEVPLGLGPAIVKADCYRFKVSPKVSGRFALHYLNSSVAQRFAFAHHHGMTLVRIGLGNFRVIPFPLPPLPEQHRIVARIDELMAVCDRLKAQLTTAQTESRRLFEAVLHEALAPAA